MDRLFSSESVTEGHPDKICDRVADSILDAVLLQDCKGRVACEVVATTDYMLIMGEISANAKVDYQSIARKTIRDIGYVDGTLGFDYKTVKIDVRLGIQSPDIAQGVNTAVDHDSIGAGDQGMMFGYACDEMNNLMPMSITLAHNIARQLSNVRKSGELEYLRPDGKCQVTVEYQDRRPIRVDSVVLSAQHAAHISQQTIVSDLIGRVVLPQLEHLVDDKTKFFINNTGKFVIGGPHGDSGLSGRKIIVDTYGGHCAHGGGAFSGKDATKVDRSAAYMARYICKNIVAARLASRCLLQISYAIGKAYPTSVYVNTFETGILSDMQLNDIITKEFDLRPTAIIDKLNLQQPIFAKTSVYGHFGIQGVAWEELDMVDKLLKYNRC